MTWAYTINDLEWYNQSPIADCYSERLFSKSDLMLQGQLPATFDNAYSMSVHVFSIDGKTDRGDVTSSFNYFFGLNTNGGVYFNLTPKTWPSAICDNTCFILHVTVKNSKGGIVFDAYTQKYLVDNCCEGVNVVTVQNDTTDVLIGYDCTPVNTMTNTCGDNFLKLYTTFACIDLFTGDFYGNPIQYYGGSSSPFTFYRSSWINAVKYYLPLDIKRTVSLNCRLQKLERSKQWQVEGLTTFPLWKMQEIENMLGAETIQLGGLGYTFKGGAIFQGLTKARCRLPNDFKLFFVLEECYEYQLFACSTPCD